MPNCLKCGKPLKLIGKERKNGKGNYTDWKDNNKNPRELHKSCWKQEQKYLYKREPEYLYKREPEYKDFYYEFKRWSITDDEYLYEREPE